MACQDCNCGRKQREEAGEEFEIMCGIPLEDASALLKRYEEGDISREALLIALKGVPK